MSRLVFALVASTLLFLVACGSDETSPGGGPAFRADGAAGNGGAGGVDGLPGSGGTPSAGGSLAADGAAAGGAPGLGAGGSSGGAGPDAAGTVGPTIDSGVLADPDAAMTPDGTPGGGSTKMDGAAAEGPSPSEAGSPADGGGDFDAAKTGQLDGGETGSTFTDLFPRSGTIAGWIVDPQSPGSGVPARIATTQSEAEALIDGAAEAFYTPAVTPQRFGLQQYRNMTVRDAPAEGAALMLYILQMADPSQALGLYSAVLSDPLYAARGVATSTDPNATWKDPSSPVVGDRSRVVNTGDTWWINFYKGGYYVEVSLSPSYGPAPDYSPDDAFLKAAAFTFAQGVASRL